MLPASNQLPTSPRTWDPSAPVLLQNVRCALTPFWGRDLLPFPPVNIL